MGPSIKDVRQKSGFLDPLPRQSGLNSRIPIEITIGVRIPKTPLPWVSRTSFMDGP